jgi:hypothetical protein
MLRIFRRGALAALPALIFATACSDSGPLDIDDEQINADVALVVADATGDDMALMTDRRGRRHHATRLRRPRLPAAGIPLPLRTQGLL